VAAEGLSCSAANFLRTNGILYDPVPPDYGTYMAQRDPVLGWPRPGHESQQGRDATGARFSPAFPELGAEQSAVALYGDSFTWSGEVGDEHAWGNALAREARGPLTRTRLT